MGRSVFTDLMFKVIWEFLIIIMRITQTLLSTSDGGYLVGGNSRPIIGEVEYLSAQDTDLGMAVKLNSDGSVSWLKLLIPLTPMNVTSIVETGSGYTLAGNGYSYPAYGGLDIIVEALSFTGNFAGFFYYGGGSNEDKVYCIQKTKDGGYILAGVSQFLQILIWKDLLAIMRKVITGC